MTETVKIARDDETGAEYAWFRCPGCNDWHMVGIVPPAKPCWGWNLDLVRPTFTPSVLVWGHDLTPESRAAWVAWHDAGRPAPEPEWQRMDTRCHSFVTDGQIQFLSDCTHALANQTVPLPPMGDAPW